MSVDWIRSIQPAYQSNTVNTAQGSIVNIIYNTSLTFNRQFVGDLLLTNFIMLELRLRRLNNVLKVLTVLQDVGFIYYYKISCSLID